MSNQQKEDFESGVAEMFGRAMKKGTSYLIVIADDEGLDFSASSKVGALGLAEYASMKLKVALSE